MEATTWVFVIWLILIVLFVWAWIRFWRLVPRDSGEDEWAWSERTGEWERVKPGNEPHPEEQVDEVARRRAARNNQANASQEARG